MSTKRPVDLHILIIARSTLDAIRALIAMDFGCRKNDPRDFYNSEALLRSNPLTVDWPEQLLHEAQRLSFLFHSTAVESEAPGETTTDPDTITLGGDQSQDHGNHSAEWPTHLLTSLSSTVRHLDAVFRVPSEFSASLFAPIQRAKPANGRLGALTIKRIQEFAVGALPPDDDDVLPERELNLRFHFFGTAFAPDRIKEIWDNHVADPQDSANISVLLVEETSPVRPLRRGSMALSQKIDLVMTALQEKVKSHVQRVPFVVATGELAASACLTPNPGTWRDLYDLHDVDTRYATRERTLAYLNPVAEIYGYEYLTQYTSNFNSADDVADQLAGADRCGFDVRVVPFDLNGVDRVNVSIGSICLPERAQSEGRHNWQPGALRSTLFDRLAMDSYERRFQDYDFWKNMVSRWMPVRTSSILGAAVFLPNPGPDQPMQLHERLWY